MKPFSIAFFLVLLSVTAALGQQQPPMDLATPEELQETFGVSRLIGREMIEELVLWFNEPENREVGVPGAGGFGHQRQSRPCW